MKVAYDLIYLISCGINGTKADTDRSNAMDLSELYKISKRHFLNAICCMALEEAGIKNDSFITAKNKAIRKNLLLDADRMKLTAFLDKNEIWYLPLKGIILKDLYPKSGMRQMSDNDILFDRKFQKQVYDYFISNGYTAESYGKTHHDTYLKEPVYNYEMHTSLMSELTKPLWYEYYKNVRERLICDGYSCRFSDEDFYIYITVHTAKHFENGGTGLRSLLDTYVYLKAKENSLDFEYIKAECEKLGIAEFEKSIRKLAKKVFGTEFTPESLTEEERNMLEYFLGSGAYGTQKNAIENKLKKSGKGKLHYLISRMFPDREFMKGWCRSYAPKLEKFLPAAYLWRLMHNGVTRFGKWRGELKELKKIK